MRVGILSDGPDLSSYLAEMFNTWGLVLYEMVGPDRISEAGSRRCASGGLSCVSK